MLRRMLVGLFIGLVVGLVMALGVVKGLGMAVLTGAGGAVVAYLGAAVTGVLTGFVAGKPIWSQGGKVEAGLKAFFGALLAAGGMFALRRWAGTTVDLSSFGAGAGALGELAALTFPIIALVLGTFFEIDNTPPTEKEKAEAAKKKALPAGDAAKLNGKKRVDVPAAEEEADDDLEVPSKKAKR